MIGWNFASTPAQDPADDFVGDGTVVGGHGTRVAGIIGARAQTSGTAVGIAGIAWKTQIIPVKVMDSAGSFIPTGSWASVVSGINYITDLKQQRGVNVRVTNNSYGGFGYGSTSSTAVRTAIQGLAGQGILFVASAGNDGNNNDDSDTPRYPANEPVDNILTVAATDRNDVLSNFSDFGPNGVDLGAPGETIYSTLKGGGYGSDSGTSFAAPHVAGVAALAFAYKPTASYDMVRDAILQDRRRV